MSMEINLLANKHKFEKNLPVQETRAIRYNLDNAALVTIGIQMDSGLIEIHLGKKYYRLAKLEYYERNKFIEGKYNRYTPSLPVFPYNLRLELTTNGTFSIYDDGSTEPFLEYHLNNAKNVPFIFVSAPASQTDLIAFVDCSEKFKPNCGAYRTGTLTDCRKWLVKEKGVGYVAHMNILQKSYEDDVLFDEFIVVDVDEYSSSKLSFGFDGWNLNIEFKFRSIVAKVREEHSGDEKRAQITQWLEVPVSPYAVRVFIKNGKNADLLISNILREQILYMSLCMNIDWLKYIHLEGPKLYLECLYSELVYDFYSHHQITIHKRGSTSGESSYMDLEYHENGYNFSKNFLYTRQFVSEPHVVYEYEFGNSTEDWCKNNPQPELYVTTEKSDDSLYGLTKSSAKELQKISIATADSNTAVLSELRKISKATTDSERKISSTADTNAAILTELQNVKASIDELAKHLQQNTTTGNNYNQLNVTEFLKLLKQN